MTGTDTDRRYYRGLFHHAKYRREILDWAYWVGLFFTLVYVIVTFHGSGTSYRVFAVLNVIVAFFSAFMLWCFYGDFLFGSPELEIIYVGKNKKNN